VCSSVQPRAVCVLRGAATLSVRSATRSSGMSVRANAHLATVTGGLMLLAYARRSKTPRQLSQRGIVLRGAQSPWRMGRLAYRPGLTARARPKARPGPGRFIVIQKMGTWLSPYDLHTICTWPTSGRCVYE